ncbi:MAG: hypothetical protein B6U87_00410 [Candidatus Aenigmarchaeota archaeon ex4484_52]|nr:MAG: hypothetical protein B6U87_00410 [Candidatus Aenigmarchaeota archaeon ex4484_52]
MIIQKKYFDLLIVGAGPVGSTLANELLKYDRNFKICILEEHKKSGTPQQCSGLFSKNISDVVELKENEILQKIKGADLYSPSNFKFSLNTNKIQAYVIDRTIFDMRLAKQAKISGAGLLLNTKFLSAKKCKDIYKIKILDKLKNKENTIYSKYIAACDGASSIVAKKFNFPKMQCIYGYAIIIKAKTNQDKDFISKNKVALYFGEKIAPDFFLWKIPRAKQKTIEIGIASKKKPQIYLNEFIKRQKINKKNIIHKMGGLIPCEMRSQIIKNNIILVGDAAGQVKSTTGGGVIYGMKSAKIAANAIFLALKNNNNALLNNYSFLFNKSLGAELKKLKFIRNFLNSKKDAQIDFLIKTLDKKQIKKFIENYGDMDTVSPLIFELLKHPELWIDFFIVIYKILKNYLLK